MVQSPSRSKLPASANRWAAERGSWSALQGSFTLHAGIPCPRSSQQYKLNLQMRGLDYGRMF